jgi:hypothetical protein
MNPKDLQSLYAIVRAALDKYLRAHVEARIYLCHNGQLDDDITTTANLHLFRQYRNQISHDPKHLTNAAIADGERYEGRTCPDCYDEGKQTTGEDCHTCHGSGSIRVRVRV